MTLISAPTSALTTRITFLTKEDSDGAAAISGEAGEVSVRSEQGTVTIACGLGEKKLCTPDRIRSAAARGVQKALDLKRGAVALVLPARSLCGEQGALTAVEGALSGAYRFSKYKTEKPSALKRLECIGPAIAPGALRRLETVCSAADYARDLVNENASIVTPQRLAHEARAIAHAGNMRVTVFDEKEIERKGLRLLAAVGRASPTPPRLIVMEYRGDRSSRNATALVGKGITFDSGGQNLKPTGHIETMRLDMAGAAVVLAVMKAAAALRLGVNLVGCIPAAHNAIGSNAYFPGDVYRSFAGKTVEINSTDAEGRLILADAIAYVRKQLSPARIVELSTLTGGILSALGEIAAGLFSNDDTLAHALFTAGEKTGERLWRFPLYQEYRDSMKSDIADLRNVSKFKKGYASSITGAAFIQEFVGDTPWAHLDIAGTAWNEGGVRGEVPQYATGFGVRLLVSFLSGEPGR